MRPDSTKGARPSRMGHPAPRNGKTPAESGRGLVPSFTEGRSAADLEDLGAALRAGALERGLAVLHRDLLRVLDFDLHLVLHAVGHRHEFRSSSSLQAPRARARSHAAR